MFCCGRMKKHKKRMDEKRPKTLKTKSSESLAENLKDYYRNSPERKHKVIVVHRNTFFDDDDDYGEYHSSPAKIKPRELL